MLAKIKNQYIFTESNNTLMLLVEVDTSNKDEMFYRTVYTPTGTCWTTDIQKFDINSLKTSQIIELAKHSKHEWLIDLAYERYAKSVDSPKSKGVFKCELYYWETKQCTN